MNDMEVALARLSLANAIAKSKASAGKQPRVPSGPKGGQWTAGGFAGGGGSKRRDGDFRTPRERRTEQFLEDAKARGDAKATAHARKLVEANRLGRKAWERPEYAEAVAAYKAWAKED